MLERNSFVLADDQVSDGPEFHDSLPPRSVPVELGATEIASRTEFERLARRDDVPGALGLREVKFLMTGVDTPSPNLYFMNTRSIVFHYDFAVRVLGLELPVAQFNALTYFRDDRSNLAGTILAHDRVEGDQQAAVYALEFWPTDPVRAHLVALAFHAVSAAMPFASSHIAFHPAGETQESLFRADEAELDRLGVRSTSSDELFANVTYSPLNLGVGYGVLRVVDPEKRPGERPPSLRDVLVFTNLPNDLTHVGGVISEMPQTPLSHVNLRAKQNDTPNAYVKNASTHPRVQAHQGRVVRYEVSADDFSIRNATQSEAQAHLDQLRPAMPQHPQRNLAVTAIGDLSALGHASATAFGAKAANVAELRNVLAPVMVPDGFAIPFSFYDEFMRANRLYDVAAEMMADQQFGHDVDHRHRRLEDLRDQIEGAGVPSSLASQIAHWHARVPAGQALRCRSSTNNEDLVGFNGAGLYDSYTHRPKEGELAKTVKQVWASLWNLRAFEEREFYRVEHFEAAMGVLVHPNFDDELANGVAVTKNIYDPNWPGFYVNVQVGESLVTNPEDDATPDEFLVSVIPPQDRYEVQYIRRSSEVTDGAHVLDASQVRELTATMEKIHVHFKKIYDREHDAGFAMDIEFKIDQARRLVVKQARPWVE